MKNRWLVISVCLGYIAVSNYRKFAMRRIHSSIRRFEAKRWEVKIDYENQKIYGELIFPKDHKADTLIIASHGFNGSMTYFKQGLGYRLAEEGYALYAYDFINGSRHSRSGGKIENMSVLDEIAQLKAVYSHFQNEFENIILAGESQGGLITTLAISELEHIKAVILYYPAYSAVDHAVKRLANGENEMFRVKLKTGYTKELAAINLEEKIRNITIPAILIHGSKDKTVDIGYSYWAKELNPDIELHVITDKDHGFDQEGREEASQYVSEFLKRL